VTTGKRSRSRDARKRAGLPRRGLLRFGGSGTGVLSDRRFRPTLTAFAPDILVETIPLATRDGREGRRNAGRAESDRNREDR
jgi:hypothetical protein